MTGCAALDCPAPTTGKLICKGETLNPVESWPEPLSGTETGMTPELDDEMLSAAAMAPVALGVKTICTAQLEPMGSDAAPHVLEAME